MIYDKNSFVQHFTNMLDLGVFCYTIHPASCYNLEKKECGNMDKKAMYNLTYGLFSVC